MLTPGHCIPTIPSCMSLATVLDNATFGQLSARRTHNCLHDRHFHPMPSAPTPPAPLHVPFSSAGQRHLGPAVRSGPAIRTSDTSSHALLTAPLSPHPPPLQQQLLTTPPLTSCRAWTFKSHQRHIFLKRFFSLTAHCPSATPPSASLPTALDNATFGQLSGLDLQFTPATHLLTLCPLPLCHPTLASFTTALDNATFDQLSGLDLQVTLTTADTPLSIPDAPRQVLVGPYLGPNFGSLYLQGSG